MIIVMTPAASAQSIEDVIGKIRAAGLSEHVSRGTERTIIGAVGDERSLQPSMFEMMPGVERALRVLVAEDNSISTKVIRGMLGKLNLEPDTACNGEEALQAMKAQRYDLVLMDCEMPVLDGFSATQQLRAWEAAHQRPRTPVVALTAHILAEHKERAKLAGMDGHMAKPVELSQLRELIQYWANHREAKTDPAPIP